VDRDTVMSQEFGTEWFMRRQLQGSNPSKLKWENQNAPNVFFPRTVRPGEHCIKNNKPDTQAR
jgi:hypothetical protein